MAVIPSFVGPAYGADMSSLFKTIADARSKSTATELEAHSDIMRTLMQNADSIAKTSGSPTLDKIAQSMGGAQGPLFGGDYASAMDRLNQQKVQADISRLNRVGTGKGGGGAGGSGKQKATEWLIRDTRTGIESWVDPSDLDASVLQELRGAGGGWEVLQYGRAVTEPSGIELPPSSGGSGDAAGITKVDGKYYDDVTGEEIE